MGFYSACLLAGVTPTAEFFLTSFSQRTQKDEFLYFVVKKEMKGFYEAFLSKVEPETWRPFFFFASGEGFPLGVPSGFTSHPNSKSALPKSAKHKMDAIAFPLTGGINAPCLYTFTPTAGFSKRRVSFLLLMLTLGP
ncbi:hypothetical protein LIER_31826 [Lithospermum erythrorhizon]|uniref:Uncharacterized protein n=1 Tax=Lithospermum erythrorhizon TaxID=34254 RepID=A0AAV3RU01_LITER